VSVSETLLSVIIGVIIGGIIGFLSSIGFDIWKEGREKRELKERIRQELEIILKEVSSDYEKGAFQSRGFFTEAFTALKPYLIRELDAKTYREVLETYIKIDSLRTPDIIPDMDKKHYKETIEVIKHTIDLLK
jgi:hypothetical protein